MGKSTLVHDLLNHIISGLTRLVINSESADADLVKMKLVERYKKILPDVLYLID